MTVPDEQQQLREVIAAFVEAARRNSIVIEEADIVAECLRAPHRRPSRLPLGKHGVYWFTLRNCCLKVGKVGPLSAARYTSQHYNPKSSNSNLAKSILKSRDRLKRTCPVELHPAIDALTEESVGIWIEQNCTRFNVLIDAKFDDFALTLLESVVQSRFRPIFEGRAYPLHPEAVGQKPKDPPFLVTADTLNAWRRQLIRWLGKVDPHPTDKEGVVTKIKRLSDVSIGKETAALMISLVEMRNSTEYRFKQLTPAESEAVRHAWLAIVEWAKAQGLAVDQ